MADVFTKVKRSEVMSRIRGSENRETELALISIFRGYGITGWRRRQKIFGNPDFVFRKQSVAIFVDGCFWHQCPTHSKIPKENKKFWREKLLKNVERDKLVNKTLRQMGWRVLRVWAHELSKKSVGRTIWRIQSSLCKGRLHSE